MLTDIQNLEKESSVSESFHKITMKVLKPS